MPGHADVDVGTGATLTFTTTSWTAQILNMEHSDITRDEIETTHLGTTGGKTFMPGDLYDPGELEVEFHLNPDNPPPFTAVKEVVQILYPAPGGTVTTSAREKVEMFISSFGKTIPLEDKLVGTIKLKCSGSISQTDAG